MGGGSTPGTSPIDAWREELEVNAAARSKADDETKDANAKVNREALLDMTPIISNYRSARRAVDSGELALVHNRNQRSGEFAKHAGMFGADVLGAVSGLPFSKLARATTQGASSRTNIFGGIGAKTADHSALERAKDMQKSGADRADIWKETGWFQGAEGKWKFEIDDSAARMTPHAERVLDQKGPGGRAVGNFGQFMDHPELSKAYPDVPYGFTALQRGDGAGAFHDYDNLISIEARNTPEAKRIGLHEVQHRIQRDEGFAPGANPTFGHGIEDAWKAAKEAYEASDQDAALLRGLGLSVPDSGALKPWDTLTQREKLPWLDQGRERLYYRSAGEVEARNVEARSAMDAEGRRNLPPWETQSVPDTEMRINEAVPGVPQNVFMVAPESKKSEKAFQMRDEGATNEQVAKETRRHFGPEGKLRVESDDWNVPVNTSKIGVRPGEVVPMRQVFPHHGLFSHNPDLGELPVSFRQSVNPGDVAFKGDKGYSVLPLGKGEGFEREQLAKVLQYELSKKHGFAGAITHDMGDALAKYQEAIRRVQSVIDNPKPGDDLEAALRWQEHAEPMVKRLEEAAASNNNSTGNRISKRFGGNAEARAVRERSYGGANKVYPYNNQQYQGLVTMPQENLSREELAEFLKNWRTYGVGRDLFGGL